jgi:hypothetical protein
MITAEQVEMFPSLPRNTVFSEVRDDYNRFKRDQEKYGGLMPLPLAQIFLMVSRQRLYELMEENKVRWVEHQGHRYISGDDIAQRLADIRDGKLVGGRPRKRGLTKA